MRGPLRRLSTPHWRLPAAALALVILSITFCLAGLHRAMEDTLGSYWLFQVRGPLPPPSDVLVVAIDSDTGPALGLPRLPVRWPRDIHAAVVDRLAGAGAAAIVLDIAFRGELRGGEAELASSLRAAGNTVLFKHLRRDARRLPADGLALEVETEELPPEPLASAARAIAPFTLPMGVSSVARTALFRDGVDGPEASQPLMALQIAARRARGTVFPVLLREAPEVASALARARDEQAVARSLRQVFRQAPWLADEVTHALSTAATPVRGRWLEGWVRGLVYGDRIEINFYGPQRTVPTIAYERVHAGEREVLKQVRDRIVFVGFSEAVQTEQQDSHPTVYSDEFGNELAGVEIAATVAANLSEGRLLERLSPTLEMLAVTLWCLVLLVPAAALRLRTSLPVQILTVLGLIGVALVLFSRFTIQIPLATPLLVGWPLAFGAGLMVRYGNARAREARLTNALAHYLPAEAARAVSRSLAPLHAQRSVVTGLCLMTDVRGFSGWAQHYSATEVHARLNDYYQRIMSDVEREGGVVANLVGDAMLALWTAPWIDEALAAAAARSALAVTAPGRVVPGHETCAALHGGAFSLGNLGSGAHYEFAPVGHIVNVTANMEVLNRDTGTRVLVSADIARRLGGFILRYVGTFTIKGAGPERLYELLGEGPDAELSELAVAFEEILTLYETGRRPDDVRRAFIRLLERFPEDGPSRYYLGRLEKQQHPLE